MQRGTMATLGSRPAKRKQRHTPLGALIAGLLSARLSARTVIDRYFPGLQGTRVTTAIRFGSLADGRRRDRDRPLQTRAARRMLACYLMHAEQTDPRTMRASGSALWQGTQARKLGFALTPQTNGSPTGSREVQRYARIFVRFGVLQMHQPDAARVPDAMRGKLKTHRARGRDVSARWAYNVAIVCGTFSDAIRSLLTRTTKAAPAGSLVPAFVAAARTASTSAEFFGAMLAAMRARAPRAPA